MLQELSCYVLHVKRFCVNMYYILGHYLLNGSFSSPARMKYSPPRMKRHYFLYCAIFVLRMRKFCRDLVQVLCHDVELLRLQQV